MVRTKSFNLALRKAYFQTLSSILYNTVAVPVYSEMAPDTTPDLYITFSSINNSDASVKECVISDCSVVVSIYSRSAKYNNANAVDVVADEVLQRLTDNITLEGGFQIVWGKITNDNTQNFRVLNQLIAIDRLITITHKIHQQ